MKEERDLLLNKILKEDEEQQIKIIKKMKSNGEKLMSYYKCAIMEIETKFKVLNEQFALLHERNPIDTIKTRLKSYESIIEKLYRRNVPINIDSIEEYLNDIAGVRVICAFVDDIYFLADCLVLQDDVKLIKWKDYIERPKDNGYRSLHLIVEIPIFLYNEKKYVKVEVQLRTIAMESWANLEHRLRYKKGLSEEKLQLVDQSLNDCAQLSFELDKKMQLARNIVEK